MGDSNGGRSRDAPRTLEVDSPGVLSIVEAAYDIDSPPDTWALEMLRAADRAIGAGIGAFVCLYDQPHHGTPSSHTTSAFSLGINDEMMSVVFDQYATAPPDWLSGDLGRNRGSARCLLTSELESEGTIDPRRECAVRDVYDGVNIAATDVTDRGFLMSLAVPAHSNLSPTARRILTRVASHIVGAMRLRARLEGEHYVPARENRSRPPPRGPSSLTEAERSVVTAAAQGQTTKEIAYALCIAETTVRVLLMRAVRRCGVQNRRELLNLWSQNEARVT